MKKIFTIAAIALFMISCSEDNNEPINPTVDAPILLKHYSREDGNYIQNYDIEYDGNRMIKLQLVDDFLIQNYNYTNNILTYIKTTSSSSSYELFIEYYQNGKIKKNTIIDQTGEIWRNELSYPNNNSYVETSYVGMPEPSITTYTLQNKNIITEESYGRRIEYEYDDKNAPKKNVDFADTFNFIRFDNDGEYGNNNRTKLTIYIENEIYQIYTYEYTYNSNNYPLTKKTFHNGQYLYSITYSYE